MTDNDIIKALECCSTATCFTNKCPYEEIYDIPKCTTKLTRDALDLINRQKAEIERLQSESIGKCEIAISMRNDNNLDSNCNYCIDKSKAEAVKEFAERLKRKGTPEYPWEDFSIRESDIDEVLKEMVGESK